MKVRLTSVFAFTVIVVLLLALSAAPLRSNAQTATMAATANNAVTQLSALVVTLHDGVPAGLTKDNWNKAFGVAMLTPGAAGNSLDVELAGLVPNGLYTIWWINTQPSVSRGILGKSPNDSFTADAHGNGSASFDIPADSTYQLLTIVYQADKTVHGAADPGTMGSTVYTQLVGTFPAASMGSAMAATSSMSATQAATASAAAMSKAYPLIGVTFNGIPPQADKSMWVKQIGVASMTMGSSGTDSVVLRLGRLVPNGLYTAWWINSTPQRATGILSKAPGDPINADADGWANLSFEAPSDNTYQRIGVFFQASGKMPGTDTPGAMGSVAYIALIGAFPGPAGINAPLARPTPRATMSATAGS